VREVGKGGGAQLKNKSPTGTATPPPGQTSRKAQIKKEAKSPISRRKRHRMQKKCREIRDLLWKRITSSAADDTNNYVGGPIEEKESQAWG